MIPVFYLSYPPYIVIVNGKAVDAEKFFLDKVNIRFYNECAKAMTRTSSKRDSPTESGRLVRGAGRIFYEYISKLRTES